LDRDNSGHFLFKGVFVALNEACQLWIEQEIDEGLKEGKKPYSIGKEISRAIEKLFEAKIPSETIRTRARRQQKKAGQMTSRGGRPPKYQQKQEKTPEGKSAKRENSFAIRYARMAIADLDCIQIDDPYRLDALKEVQDWLSKQKKGAKPIDRFELLWKEMRQVLYELRRNQWLDTTAGDILAKLDVLVRITNVGK
jgi:hypothetical protein